MALCWCLVCRAFASVDLFTRPLNRNRFMALPQSSTASWPVPHVGALVLAGGKSTRMGGMDKAFLRVGGEPVVARTLALLRGCFAEVVVVSNQPDKYSELAVVVASDEFEAAGPLAGIHAGMGRLSCPYAFVVACDMPFLRIEPIAYLIAAIRKQDAIIPRWDNDIEPLHAIYATSLRPRIADALSSGTRAIRDFLPTIEAEYVPESVLRGIAGAEESFRNVNTPEEAALFHIAPPLP